MLHASTENQKSTYLSYISNFTSNIYLCMWIVELVKSSVISCSIWQETSFAFRAVFSRQKHASALTGTCKWIIYRPRSKSELGSLAHAIAPESISRGIPCPIWMYVTRATNKNKTDARKFHTNIKMRLKRAASNNGISSTNLSTRSDKSTNNYGKNKKDSDFQNTSTSPFFGITWNPFRW